MNKIKDFFYDKNDIIIAVLILVAAALIIGWRMQVILDYPKQLLGNGDAQVEQPADDGSDAQDGNSDSQGDNSDVQEPGSDNGGENSSDQNNPDATPVETPLWVNGALSKDVEVSVEGNSASAAVQCLIDAGLFEDYSEYKSICANAGLNHEKVSAGTFTFEKGATKAQIAKKINWS